MSYVTAGGFDGHVSFAHRIKLRLFLEGIECPVIAAVVQCAPNGPAVCSIQVPPLLEGTRLLPRTLVHLFFLDHYAVANPMVTESKVAMVAQGSGQGDQLISPTAAEVSNTADSQQTVTQIRATACGDALKTWDNHRYKLLFGGEIVGFTWTKSPMNRSLIFQCEDWSNYWDYAYQWSNTDIFGPGMKAVFSGGATNLFTDFLTDSGNMLVAIILQGKSQTYPKMRGLAAGIMAMVEAIGGSYYH